MVKPNGSDRLFTTQQSLDSYVKSICDIMRRSDCAGALQYVPELTWILFLRILDELEQQEQEELEVLGQSFTPSLDIPYRWRDWAAPYDEDASRQVDGFPQGWKRKQLTDGAEGELFDFLNGDLIPHLKALKEKPSATPRQKVISEVMSGVERTRIDTEKNFQDVLDKVHAISQENIDTTHIFALSQVYEGLLLKMGEKGNDGGQFFTPRVVIRAMVKAIDPKIGETVYDPGCGTGGFLAEGFNHVRTALGDTIDAEQQETLKYKTFYGREKDNAIYPIALANLVLHGIDLPHIWHGNTLTGGVTYEGLFDGAPAQFDVILMNPPFGGKEGKAAQTNFAYQTGSTQTLYLQHTIAAMKPGGRCGIVLDEGILFRTNETAFVQTKRKLLDDCNVWAIVSLPPGVFTSAGAGVKTNLVFFTKGEPTESIWYYDLSDRKVTKRKPLLDKDFDEFFQLLPQREDSDRSWTVTRQDIEDKNFDLKAVNPNKVIEEDTRTPQELLDIIEAKGKAAAVALAKLR